ncbi:MAG: hypothetical protein KAR83_00070 [Thermodesulfovibrionales bacterium]|nr:hypothetical protein [Thermodesulfovibrionales bacterium]
MSRDSTEKYSTIVLFLLMFLGACSKAFLAFNNTLNSDDSNPAMVFYDIFNHGNYLMQDWYFPSNSYFFTEFPVYAVLGLVMGMGPMTVRLGAMVFFIGISAVFFVVMRRTFGHKAALWSLAIFLCLPPYSSSIYLHVNIHVGTLLFGFVVLYLIRFIALRGDAGDGNKGMRHVLLHAAVVLLSGLAAFSDPFYIFFLAVPVLASIFVMRFAGCALMGWRDEAFLSGGLVAASVGGLALQSLLQRAGVFIYRPPAASVSWEMVPEHLTRYFHALSLIFGFDAFVGGATVGTTVSATANLLLLVLACVYFFLLMRSGLERWQQFVLIFFLMMTGILSASIIAKEGPGAPRYLMPFVLPYAALIGIYVARASKGMILNGIMILIVVASLFNCAGSLVQEKDDSAAGLASFLEKEGLRYGFSDHGHSAVVTMNSKGSVWVSPVHFTNFVLEPKYWTSNARWYRSSFYSGASFLMLTDNVKGEMAYLTPSTLSLLFGDPQRTLRYEDMTIYVWPYNILR